MTKEYQRDYRKKNLEKVRKYGRDHYQRHAEKRRENQRRFRAENPGYQKQWRDANPERRRNHWLTAKYGLTTADFWKLFRAQKGNCKICKIRMRVRGPQSCPGKCCVDHNHKTG